MNFLKKIIIVLLLSSTLVTSIIFFSVVGLGNVFHDSYNAVIQRKYDYLKSIDEPKIILIGGSNLAFGIDLVLLENLLGMPVANMGLHAGMGHRFNTEIAKTNIKENDIVILSYEYDFLSESSFENIGADLVFTGIDNKLEMYQYLSLKDYFDLLAYFENYTFKKIQEKISPTKPHGVYNSRAFDANGNMTFYRSNPHALSTGKTRRKLKSNPISVESANYIKDFKTYVESLGAEIYFTTPPILEGTLLYDNIDDLNSYSKYIKDYTGIELISSPSEYEMPLEYMYDTIYHLNTSGSIYRTNLLANDIISNVFEESE